MFTRILVPLDGSYLAEQVLPYAYLLSERLNTPVHLLRVVEPVPGNSVDLRRELHRSMEDDTEHRQAHHYLAQLKSLLKEHGHTITGSVTAGSAARTIVQEAEQDTGTLVAMSTHGRSGLGRWVLGSVADEVLHAVTNSTLMVGPRCHGSVRAEASIDEVVVPVDGSNLAAQAVPMAAAVAKRLSVTLTVLCVVPSAAFLHRARGIRTAFGPVWVDAEGSAERYTANMAAALAMEGVAPVRRVVTSSGSPAQVIAEYAHAAQNPLVVMATHGRSGINRTVMGSVSDPVVRDSNRPVLMVRSRVFPVKRSIRLPQPGAIPLPLLGVAPGFGTLN